MGLQRGILLGETAERNPALRDCTEESLSTILGREIRLYKITGRNLSQRDCREESLSTSLHRGIPSLLDCRGRRELRKAPFQGGGLLTPAPPGRREGGG